MNSKEENSFYTLTTNDSILNLNNYDGIPLKSSLESKINPSEFEKGLEKETLKNESTLLINDDNSKGKNINNLEVENNKINKTIFRLKHYGNTHPLYFDKNGEPLITIGPHCKIN